MLWFALSDDRPPFAFAGIWTTFNGDCSINSRPIPGPHLEYGLLARETNAVVKLIHPGGNAGYIDADEERDVWMRAALARGEGTTAATIAG